MNKFESILEGMKIFQKYGECSVAAEHDVFYCGPTDKPVDNPEDLKRLDDLGWHEGDVGWEIFT